MYLIPGSWLPDLDNRTDQVRTSKSIQWQTLRAPPISGVGGEEAACICMHVGELDRGGCNSVKLLIVY
ncbi:hypothetical protein CJ030_MR6G006007 [Morella rubra]|uniref:Uncharacterized protein n=1 Tax=Morella rubra TaxID=262757 RepID=A0A6A1VAS2_9ROSI|nr:hypothetical protein CJ030_MR6G006007 [Morella rubra]